jgi:hypothetical protein
MAGEPEEILVPQMLKVEVLSKILVAYLKCGADKAPASSNEVAQLAKVASNNVGLNNRFFESIGLLEGQRGSYKLTEAGANYARALDWGRVDEANKILFETIKDKPVVQKTVSYVSLNKPVGREDLVGRIATIANVKREPRFETGIKALIDMLVVSNLLKEEESGQLVPASISEKPKEALLEPFEVTKEKSLEQKEVESYPKIAPQGPAIGLTVMVDSNTDVEKLKAILRAIKEVLAEGQ